MIDEIGNYLEKFDEKTKQRFHILHELIYESTSKTIHEKLWAKLPSFYVESNFIRVIPFKDHINVEAKAVLSHKDELSEYKITPKGMLQIFHNQQISNELLKVIFKESLK
ncbi:DUF1801 domain-containing protein [Clostridium sp. D2Q-14]|uniref:DUF1801 domain-containing protein n=1 Tax=Anaeromonas gelatinilytica TaxID=2683194 RepID=UPI00193B2F24|nr:DUF1801 domain-containing protein [Anaeromonas gelatinilytica]MBS4536502.1 DUF1801 domain-containing protein [Anaeromonas gelatinilytica]